MDGVQEDVVAVPVVGAFVHPHTGVVDPACQVKGAVIEHGVGISPITAIHRVVEVFPGRIVGWGGHQLFEERNWLLEFHFQNFVADGAHSQRFARHLARIDGLGVLHRKQDKGVLRGGSGFKRRSPGETKVMRGHRLAIAPACIFPDPEGGAIGTNLPTLRSTSHQIVVDVVAQQAFHDVAQNAGADLVRCLHGIKLGRFLIHQYRDAAGLKVDGVGGGGL